MKRTQTITMVVTILVALVVVNYLAARHPVRVDLTQNKIFTLSDSTRAILKDLDDVVTVRLYFTRDLPPALQALRRGVDDLLAEFQGIAGRRFQVESIDPGSSLIEEQKAALLGIPPVQVNVLRRDKQEVAKVYLGMAVMYEDRQEVLPIIDQLENLEYKLAEAIVMVSADKLPAIAWWEAGRKNVEEGEGFEVIREFLGRRYEIGEVTDKTLADLEPNNFAALVLASPRKLRPNEMRALDGYLVGGGRILALIDRWEVTRGLGLQPVDTKSVDLLVHYGVTVEDDVVLDQSNAMAAFTGGIVTYHMHYPFWPDIRKGQFDADQPIVADLESVVLPWTSSLVVKEGDQKAILAHTTSFATAEGKEAKLDPKSANEALSKGERRRWPLIALLKGPFTSYFAGKEKAAEAEGSPGARLFVVGSSRWLRDRYLGTFPANAILFENAVDSLAIGDALIGIRSREATSRPIALLSEGAKLALRYVNVTIGPALVMIIGILIFVFRRTRRRTATLAYRRRVDQR